MMCESTPVSLTMLDEFAELATELLGSPVLPGRAKGTEYFGATGWHRDSQGLPLSLGDVCYLEPLVSGSGALEIIPGSHRDDLVRVADSSVERRTSARGLALATVPGDVIVFDERLLHSSSGGTTRRQWRIDFVADRGDSIDDLRRYYTDQHQPGWDGGYDVDLYPSYSSHWKALNAKWNRRLNELGTSSAATAEESYLRARRQGHTP